LFSDDEASTESEGEGEGGEGAPGRGATGSSGAARRLSGTGDSRHPNGRSRAARLSRSAAAGSAAGAVEAAASASLPVEAAGNSKANEETGALEEDDDEEVEEEEAEEARPRSALPQENDVAPPLQLWPPLGVVAEALAGAATTSENHAWVSARVPGLYTLVHS
jgi:hypothetical protein